MSRHSKINRRNRCSSMLSKELSKEYKTRSMGIKRGDTVSIIRGNFRGVEGKVVKVDHKNNLIHVEGVTREKADGEKIFVPISTSKVMINKLDLEDKRRKDILDRRASVTIPGYKIRAKSGRSGRNFSS